MGDIIGVILAGGSGTRLWPLSRKLVPKQLISLTGDRSLLQETSRRILPVIGIENQWVITNNDLFHQIEKQMTPRNQNMASIAKCARVFIEPQPKNTAPAIIWAAFMCKKLYGNDSVMVVLPSDHLITKDDEFIEVIKAAVSKASEECLVTIGIKPTYPETGFGYIKTESEKLGENIKKIDRFVEKPDINTARQYIDKGNYLWNSGMFVFHVGTLINEVNKYCSNIYDAFSKIDPENDSDIKKAFNDISSISIDYAIMEHTDKAYVIQCDIGWSDVGNWKSLYEAKEKNSDGNVVTGEHLNIDTKGSLIYGKDRLIVTLGMKDVAIVDTADALLVAPLDQTHRIREVVDSLNSAHSKIHIEHLTVERPWGQYTVLQEGPGYKIKKIIVNPGEKLSKQYHHHRSEHWIVVRGTGKITKADGTILIHENESTYIPIGATHRLENPGKVPLEIIEAQCGFYLEEDDIVRLDDIYERNDS